MENHVVRFPDGVAAFRFRACAPPPNPPAPRAPLLPPASRSGAEYTRKEGPTLAEARRLNKAFRTLKAGV